MAHCTARCHGYIVAVDSDGDGDTEVVETEDWATGVTNVIGWGQVR